MRPINPSPAAMKSFAHLLLAALLGAVSSAGFAQAPEAAAPATAAATKPARPDPAKGDTISRIVPTLSPGTHVSTSKNDIDYVVTEFGVARLRGRSARDRARLLIGIAHPDFRAQLTEQAEQLRLL